MIDPEKEREASIAGLRSSLTTLKIECALRGQHWVRVLRQRAIEERLANMLGLVLDFSKGQGGRAEQSTGSRANQSEGATNGET